MAQLDRARRSKTALLLTLFAGSATFAGYILATYAWAALHLRFDLWNILLSGLYLPDVPAATAVIALHFAAGATVMVLGPLQLWTPLRNRAPALHRIAGRLYLGAALGASVGGGAFIVLYGTVGGPVMSAAFSFYGLLMGICAVQTWRLAVQRRFVAHRRWALRLFVLGIGSLLYRFGYGLWGLVAGGLAGHQNDWQGPFDYAMDFLFYIPTLLICELYIALESGRVRPAAHVENVLPASAGASLWTRVGLPSTTVALVLVLGLGLVLVASQWWWPTIRDIQAQLS
ncbi:putative membrane protein [Rubidibacter lacunae KORDI 51-2]|uniref:Putative membrane protein n=1 Tax=Rubidibacter lacunae KORDI 51-2 TaxID=582515 RepID=U5DKC7_9CHRO|nr:DUF2306 domain-containing protein [Rubidibacter lacunae]ERN40145.1 putative membrane protein [Rubidibacter lacunae KORDI 51-2]